MGKPIYQKRWYWLGAMSLKWLPLPPNLKSETVRERGYRTLFMSPCRAAKMNGAA